MIQLPFDFNPESHFITDKKPVKKAALKMGTPPEIIRQFYGKSFLTGWLKVKHSVRF